MKTTPKLVYITAGAGGMYCGSCLRDNSLVKGLEELGWDVLLLPLYTPIRVDGEDRSVDQLFFGGINVYLQQKIPFFRHLPSFLDRWLDNPKLVRRVASRAVSVSAADLGEMTLSMVRGEDGFQRKEVRRLVRWLKETVQPDLICLTNLLVGGSIPALKRELGVPVFVTLQGDDLFLDELEAPWRTKVLKGMRSLAANADGFLTFSRYYRDRMAELFEVEPGKFHLTPLGIPVDEFSEVAESRSCGRNQDGGGGDGGALSAGEGQRIGYFARLSPEKGFDLLVDAFLLLASDYPGTTLRVAGWLSEKDRSFYEAQCRKITEAGLEDRFVHVEAPDGEGKLDFFRNVDVFSVPTRFVEPKGLYLLEAFACGLPVVMPDRGVFPEVVPASGGGLLCRAEDPADLAERLGSLLKDPARARAMGIAGLEWVKVHGNRATMAEATARAFEEALRDPAIRPCL